MFALFLVLAHALVLYVAPIALASRSCAACGYGQRWTIVFLILIIGAASFASFFLWLVHPILGTTVDIAYLLLCAGAWPRANVRRILDPEILVPLLLAVSITGVFVSLIGLHSGSTPFSLVAEQRFGLPEDDRIPQIFADRLADAQDPRQIMLDWKSSDRPPLQTGLVLLQRPFVSVDIWNGWSYVILSMLGQALWIPAAFFFLGTLGLPLRSRAIAIIAIAMTYFIYVNGTFVWPKLLAAGFVLTAFAIVMDAKNEARGFERSSLAIVAALIGFGMLSHGGVAFTVPGIAAIALLPLRKTSPRAVLTAVAMFVAVLAPWIVYQKVYDPPGDRLIKYHIAGVEPIDARSAIQAIRDRYSEVEAPVILEFKKENFERLYLPANQEITAILPIAPQDLNAVTNSQFFIVMASLAYLPLGLLLVVVNPRAALREARRVAAPVGVALISLVVWCLLMFGPGTTVVHQGSYATDLLLACALAAFLVRLPWPIVTIVLGIGVYQLGLLALGPRPDYSAANTIANPLTLAIAIVAVVATVAYAFAVTTTRPSLLRHAKTA